MDGVLRIVTLAFFATMLAILVSRKAKTANVLNSLLTGVVNMQKAASTPLG
jgi:hypothetical protein